MVNFEVTSEFEGLNADIQLNAPPIYNQTKLVLHNLCKNDIIISEQKVIGKFIFNTLQSKCIYVPISVDISVFNEYNAISNNLLTYETRSNLSNKLTTKIQVFLK